MLNPTRVTQLMVEVVFLLLGGLTIFLAGSGRITVNRSGIGWLVIAVALIAWGALALARPGTPWDRLQRWNRGGSLVLLGVVMLVMTRVPFLWVAKLLAFAGLILVVRGVLGSFLILRQR
jgi:hypothetical protein